MFGNMQGGGAYSKVWKAHRQFLDQFWPFKEFKSVKEIKAVDVKDEHRGVILQELKRKLLIDIYRQHNSLSKLTFLNEFDQIKLGLPTSDELLKAADRKTLFRSVAQRLKKIGKYSGRPELELRWPVNLDELKSRGGPDKADVINRMTVAELARFIFEEYRQNNKLLETLAFQLTGDFNREQCSNILPAEHQPADHEFFFLLKAVEEKIDNVPVREFSRRETERLNLDLLTESQKLDKDFKDFKQLRNSVFKKLSPIWSQFV